MYDEFAIELIISLLTMFIFEIKLNNFDAKFDKLLPKLILNSVNYEDFQTVDHVINKY